MKAQDKIASEREGLLCEIDAKNSSGPAALLKRSLEKSAPRAVSCHTKNGLTLGSSI